jgi:hypothetical protein
MIKPNASTSSLIGSPLFSGSLATKGERGRKEWPSVDFQIVKGEFYGEHVTVSESALDELSLSVGNVCTLRDTPPSDFTVSSARDRAFGLFPFEWIFSKSKQIGVVSLLYRG